MGRNRSVDRMYVPERRDVRQRSLHRRFALSVVKAELWAERNTFQVDGVSSCICTYNAAAHAAAHAACARLRGTPLARAISNDLK